MEEKIELITAAEANKYLYQQLKQLLLPKGFIVRPGKSKYLVRLKANHVQMVYQENLYGETVIQRIAVPVWTFISAWFFQERLYLKRTSDPKAERNIYSEAAFRQGTSLKTYYDRAELARMWEEAICPQLQEQVIDFYDRMLFDDYVHYCEEEGDKTWDFGYTDSESRFFTRGYNCLWKKQYGDAREYLEKATAESEKYLNMLEAWGEQADPGYLQDMNAGKEIVGILSQRKPGWEETVQVRLEQLEKDVLEKMAMRKYSAGAFEEAYD